MKKPGDTPLLRCEGAHYVGFERVEIKDESANPTGTFKDRRSAYIIKQAVREKVCSLVLISTGNAAYSLAKYAEEAHIRVTAVVDEQLSKKIKSTLRDVCTQVIETDLQEQFLDSSMLIRMARTKRREKIWDVTNGFHAAFKTIVVELPEEPDSIVVPKGSGEAMAGMYEASQERGWRTNVIGIGSYFDERLRTEYRVYPENDVIINQGTDPIGSHIGNIAVVRAGISHEGHMMTWYAGNRIPERQAIKLAPPDSQVKAEDASRLAMGSILMMHPGVLGKYVIVVNSGKGTMGT